MEINVFHAVEIKFGILELDVVAKKVILILGRVVLQLIKSDAI